MSGWKEKEVRVNKRLSGRKERKVRVSKWLSGRKEREVRVSAYLVVRQEGEGAWAEPRQPSTLQAGAHHFASKLLSV